MSSQSNQKGRYYIITPMRNEIRTIETTIKAVLTQSVLPEKWVILDDGSTDGSEKVVAKYAKDISWIEYVRLEDRGYDFVGEGVANVLNYGLKYLEALPSVEFISKLDADLNFSADYFERLIEKMNADKNLGIISGHPYIMKKKVRHFERHSAFFPSGTARLYRACYLNEIGEFVTSVGWDTVDILRMRMKGYTTRIYSELPVHHMRPMGTRKGYLDGMIRDGRNNYITGYIPLFFISRAIFNARYFPFLLRTACMLYGYFSASFQKLPKAVTQEEYAFHASLQKKRLFFKKIDT